MIVAVLSAAAAAAAAEPTTEPAATTRPADNITISFRPKTAAATRPAAVTVTAAVGDEFATLVDVGGQSVAATGSVRRTADGQYRVTLEFRNPQPDRQTGSVTTRVVKTTLKVEAGRSARVSGVRVGSDEGAVDVAVSDAAP